MAADHIPDEQALDETLVNLVRLAGLAAAESLLQLAVGILQTVHCANKKEYQIILCVRRAGRLYIHIYVI